MPNLRRVRPALCIAAALCALAAPTSAGAATQIGQVSPSAGASCGAPGNIVQTVSPTIPYAVPAGGGVITGWQYQGHLTTPGSGRLQIWDPRGGNSYALVGRSDLVTFSAGVLHDLPARIPVSGGELLGLRVEANMVGCGVTDPASQVSYDSTADPLPGESRSLASTSFMHLSLAATLEPDADGDGFGDESQDECPTDASKQDPCPPDTDPPETEIIKTPPNKTGKSKAKYKFTSDEGGSSFECRLKGKGLDQTIMRFGECDSPRKYKRLDEGKFKFKVRAIDEAGNVDSSPAKDKFKVVG